MGVLWASSACENFPCVLQGGPPGRARATSRAVRALPLRSRRGPAVATARPADTPKPRRPHHRGAGAAVGVSTDLYGPSPHQSFGCRASRRTAMPPAGRASGPTTRTGPPAAGAPPLDPGDSGMSGRAPRPIAHRRQPDRARLVQVVRPVGRSTWTRPSAARPSEACATGCRHSRERPELWGEIWETILRKPPPALPRPTTPTP